MELTKIRDQIDNAIDLWDFDMADFIYKNNFEKFDEIKMEYVSFLYQTGQFVKLYSLICKYNENPKWWIKNTNEIIDLDFINFKITLQQVIQTNIKSIEEINNIDFKNKNCLSNFILINHIKQNTLEVKFATALFDNFIFKDNNKTCKKFFIKNSIDYFNAIANYNYIENIKFKLLFVMDNTFYATKGYQKYIDIIYSHIRKKCHLNDIKQENYQPKVAVMLSGIFRGDWQKTYLNIENNIIKPLNAKVFIATWDKTALWPGLCGGGGNWVNRMFPKLAKQAPTEIFNQIGFKQYFPRIYKKLAMEYLVNLDLSDITYSHKIIYTENYFFEEISKIIPDMQIQNDPNKTKRDLEYALNACKQAFGFIECIKLIKEYEYSMKQEFDYIVRIRPDWEYKKFDLKNLECLKYNEIAGFNNLIGLNDLCFYGQRDAMIKFLSIWNNLDKFIKLLKKYGIHGAFYYWIIFNQLKLTKCELYKDIGSDLYIPNLSKELKEDCIALEKNHLFKEDQIKNFSNFFHLISSYYKPLESLDMTDKKIFSATSRIQNHLSYKLGSAMITNSKSILGYIKMPYILMAISIAHKEQNKNLKLAKDKLPPLESYPDYKEVLKEKECFTYKLGEAFIKAHKNWYGGGYIKFLLKDVPRLKREFKAKKKS